MSTWNYIFLPMLHVNINMMKKNENEMFVLICAHISILKITKKKPEFSIETVILHELDLSNLADLEYATQY